MTAEGLPRVRLVDGDGEPGRTTETLVASLVARLGALRLVSGADTIGSLTAGYAALGRRAARAADAARLREALDRSRVRSNGEALWSALGVDAMASAPASPVIDHLRNDLALLLADDLDDVLERPPSMGGSSPPADDGLPANPVDYLVGMWAFAREVVRSVEALAATAQQPDARIRIVAAPPDPPPGPLLR